jgi:hypothetical protein
MHPELIHQMARERAALFHRDADRYRLAREAHIGPPQPLRTPLELSLSACREVLDRLAGRRGAAGRLAE